MCSAVAVMSGGWLVHDEVQIGPEFTVRRRPRPDADGDEPAKRRQRFAKPFFATVGDGVEIRRSNIPQAGNGLFATRRFEAGDPITIYEGQLITHKQAQELTRQRLHTHVRSHIAHRWDLDGSRLADGTPITEPLEQMRGLGGGAFINHIDEARVNATFDHVDSELMKKAFDDFARGGSPTFDPTQRYTFVRATKTILPGDEILTDYGKDYWREAMRNKE
jgi:hypothetical protein